MTEQKEQRIKEPKRYWQPKVWLERANTWHQKLVFLSFLIIGIGLFDVFFLTPGDYQQGITFKILYIHVPAAWFSLSFYALLAFFSLCYLIFKAPVTALLAQSAAWVGLLFTVVCLITGSLWGRPMWGTYWVWDARLTSMAVLLFLYCGYLLFVHSFTQEQQGWRMGSFLAIVGCINLPVIKWSVDWWQTLHQPASIMKFSAPSIHSSMLSALVFMAIGFLFYGLGLMAKLYKLKWQLLNKK